MVASPKLLKIIDWTIHSIRFFKDNFLIIFGLGLIAAFGRAIQLGAFGAITSPENISLEVMVESARLLIFLYALGLTNIRTGAARLVQFFTDKRSRARSWQSARQNLRTRWLPIIINLVVFLVLAFLINRFINHIAYETCMYAKLKAGSLISQQASIWALILFFKNISIIPFTLIFNALFFLWINDRLPRFPAYN